jgi:hypothetical protein
LNYRCEDEYELKPEKHTYRHIIDRNKRLQTSLPINPLDDYFDNTFCLPCKYEPTTEYTAKKKPGKPFFKRTLHGALMVIAFTYMLPMASLIARYYKETLHTWESKGWRLWLWVRLQFKMSFLILKAYLT